MESFSTAHVQFMMVLVADLPLRINTKFRNSGLLFHKEVGKGRPLISGPRSLIFLNWQLSVADFTSGS